ncbi:MAG TPA: YdcF family protein [Pirellulales bacterium]|nr:YdcF family protein [Pirellulales bacterium]
MYRIVKELLQPYTLFCLLAAGASVNLWRKRVESRRRLLFLSVPLAALVLISLPPVARLAHLTLEWRFKPRTELPEGNQALVALGGWSMSADHRRPRPLLGADSIYRCLHAAELYRRSGPCLVVVSGGVAQPEKGQPAVGPLMKELLVELGVASEDVLVDDRSRTTYENGLECRKLLSQRGVERITLVTNASHMLRAEACFNRLGFDVTPAPCHFDAGTLDASISTFLPSCDAAEASAEAAHEWLGLVWYWLRGWL